MSETLVISIDAMGGDNAPRSVIEGVSRVIKKDSDTFFFLFGDEEKIKSLADEYHIPDTRYKIQHTTDVISGDAKPSVAIRSGRESSMWKAIMSVRNGYSKAVVSAGNTGALMAMSKICLGTLSGIDRPAIAAILPTSKNPLVALDLGANAECNSQNLVEFAIMGHVLHRVLYKTENPSVGLLNIGSEETKGRDEIKEAATTLKSLEGKVNYIGFVEGNDICAGKADVIVSDGFSGNVALKTIEGTAKFISGVLKQTIRQSIISKVGFMLASPALLKMKKKMDPRNYNGAMFLGLKGISVKSHGGADAYAFACAIESAIRMAKNDLCNKIKEELRHTIDVDIPDEVIE